MTAPTMNPPRSYDTIKELSTHAGEPLRSEPVCPDPGTPCVCCRRPCEGYREPMTWQEMERQAHKRRYDHIMARDAAW